MKGLETVYNVLGIALVILALVLFIVEILPSIISSIVEIFTRASGESLAHEISGLLTISGSSAYAIEITYELPKEFSYTISASSRILTVKPTFNVKYAEKSSGSAAFATDFQDFKFDNPSSLLIEKRMKNGVSEYVVKPQ